MGDDAETAGALAVLLALKRAANPADVGEVMTLAIRNLARMGRGGAIRTDEDHRVARAVVMGRLWQAGLGGGETDGPGQAGPDHYGARDWWLDLFTGLGWVAPWERLPAPPVGAFGTLRLYRGATPGREDGISWTRSRALAEHFATVRGDGARVWCADFPAARLLACYPIVVRGSGVPRSDEFIVDARGLVGSGLIREAA